jgi:hypothetical protein
MTTEPFHLSPSEWRLLWALELGSLDLERIAKDLARLEEIGLASADGPLWRATEYGRQLAASRREI